MDLSFLGSKIGPFLKECKLQIQSLVQGLEKKCPMQARGFEAEISY